MRIYYFMIACTMAAFAHTGLKAQCNAGEVEVSLQIATDGYGYETYWQLLPNGNACGSGPIASGGNNAVGCNGAGAQNQTPGGYGNNLTVTAGPWCLTEGAEYDLFWADDYADGGGVFTVLVNGAPIGQYSGTGGTATWTFTAVAPDPYDVEVVKVQSFGTTTNAPLMVKATVRNRGSIAVSSLDLSYSVDGGAPMAAEITGLNIAPFATTIITHPTPWTSNTNGYFDIAVVSGNINGNPDPNTTNNTASKEVAIWAPAPNVIDWYIGVTPILNVVVDGSDQVNIPRDLDFYPDLNKKQLWVLNKDTEALGSSTVTVSNAGTPTQTTQFRRDGNAWHFMSLSTGIAFTDFENFGTSPGVFDSNHNGGEPFTGPALWNSDPLIYAQPSGGNGSHIDMLHTSPYAQGIAHDKDNVFWVVDGYNNDVVRYDFEEGHVPGGDDHADGIIHRYAGMNIQKDPNNHIVSHCDLDKATGWLYVVNHGADKVIRINTNTGSLGSTPTFGPFEDVAEYKFVTGFVMEDVVTTGLVEPAGIAVKDDRLLVTDHATGDIVIYDITTMPATELGRVSTGTPGIMGVTIGPDGSIWYVNATTEEVVNVTVGAVGVNEVATTTELRIAPNPATDLIQLIYGQHAGSAVMNVFDATGRVVLTERQTGPRYALQTGILPSGAYSVQLSFVNGERTQGRFLIER